MFASFHSSGNTPALSDCRLYSRVSNGAICSAVSSKSLAEISSDPVALVTSSERRAATTSQGEREISENSGPLVGGNCRRGSTVSLEKKGSKKEKKVVSS